MERSYAWGLDLIRKLRLHRALATPTVTKVTVVVEDEEYVKVITEESFAVEGWAQALADLAGCRLVDAEAGA